MSDPLLIPCPACHGLNRIPANRLADTPRCGRCKAYINAFCRWTDGGKACSGQPHAARIALEQGDAEVLLQLADRHGQRRLRDV